MQSLCLYFYPWLLEQPTLAENLLLDLDTQINCFTIAREKDLQA